MEAVIMKKIKIEFTNERIIPASGLAVVGAILGKSDFVKRCNRMDVTPNRSQHQIKNGDVLLTYIGLLTMGKPAYEYSSSIKYFPYMRAFRFSIYILIIARIFIACNTIFLYFWNLFKLHNFKFI